MGFRVEGFGRILESGAGLEGFSGGFTGFGWFSTASTCDLDGLWDLDKFKRDLKVCAVGFVRGLQNQCCHSSGYRTRY